MLNLEISYKSLLGLAAGSGKGNLLLQNKLVATKLVKIFLTFSRKRRFCPMFILIDGCLKSGLKLAAN